MNYDDAFNVSNTGTLALCTALCVSNQDLNLRAFGSSTEIVADVGGYYTTSMAASVSAGASLFWGNRVVSVARANQADGQYEVQFDRDISECTYSANINVDGSDGWAAASLRSGTTDTLYVVTHNVGNQVVDRRFMVEVTC